MPLPNPPPLRGWALRKVVAPAAAIALLGIVMVWQTYTWTRSGWHHSDMDAYWLAAGRLRDGESLYVTLAGNPDTPANYRYAPWFAWAWIPLTYLPRAVVDVGWFLLLAVSGFYISRPLVQRSVAAIGLLCLVLPAVLMALFTGNVQLVLVAGTMWSLHRPSGPIWIAVAASLKFTPLAFVLVYAARREWSKVACCLALSAILLVPMLAFDLSDYPTGIWGGALVVGLAVAAGVTALYLTWRFPRYAELWATGLTLAGNPRFHFYNLSWLSVPTSAREQRPYLAAPTKDIADGRRAL